MGSVVMHRTDTDSHATAVTVSDGSNGAATAQWPSAMATVRSTSQHPAAVAPRAAITAVHTTTTVGGATDPGTTITTVRPVRASSESGSTL